LTVVPRQHDSVTWCECPIRSQPILPGIAKKPEPPKPTTRTVYKIAAKAVLLHITAIERAAAEFKVPTTRLMAVRR
jgi:hypothetical protein